jgi:hypothetical protein
VRPIGHAAVVQVDVAGTVTGIDDHRSIMFTYAPFANLAIGDTVTGSWVYNTSTPYGPVPISGSPLGYFIQSMSFSTGGGTGAYANFSGSGLATFLMPGTGRLFPTSRMQFPCSLRRTTSTPYRLLLSTRTRFFSARSSVVRENSERLHRVLG